MNGPTAIVVAVIVVVAAGLFVGFAGGYFKANPASAGPLVDFTNDETGNGATEVQGLGLNDRVIINFAHRDSQVGSTSYVEGTDVVSTTAHRVGTNDFDLHQTGTGTEFQIKAGDIGSDGLGVVYVQFDNQAAADSLVLDYNKIETLNSELVYLAYLDEDGDGDKNWFAGFSTEGLIPYRLGAGTFPELDITVPWLNENTVTVSAPTDNTGIGTTSGTKDDTTWVVTGTAGDVSLLSKLEFRFNETSAADWIRGQSFVTIETASGDIVVSLNEFSERPDGTNVDYIYEWGTYQDETLQLIFPQNTGSATLDITLTVAWAFEAADETSTRITVSLIDQDDGQIADVQDTVVSYA